MKHLKHATLLGVVLLIVGCNRNPYPKYVTFSDDFAPVASFTYVFKFKLNTHTRLALVPLRDAEASPNIAPEGEVGDIEMQHLLHLCKFALEVLGYTIVDNQAQADLIVGVTMRNDYGTRYVPPGRILTSSTHLGTVQTPGGSAKFSGTTLSSQVVPGHATQDFSPFVALVGANKNGETLCHAKAWAKTRNPSFGLVVPWLVHAIRMKLPPSDQLGESPSWDQSTLGTHVTLASKDGNNYYPCIVQKSKHLMGSPQALLPYDLLLKFDGKSLENLDLSELKPILIPTPGKTVPLQIFRKKAPKDLELEFPAPQAP